MTGNMYANHMHNYHPFSMQSVTTRRGIGNQQNNTPFRRICSEPRDSLKLRHTKGYSQSATQRIHHAEAHG